MLMRSWLIIFQQVIRLLDPPSQASLVASGRVSGLVALNGLPFARQLPFVKFGKMHKVWKDFPRMSPSDEHRVVSEHVAAPGLSDQNERGC